MTWNLTIVERAPSPRDRATHYAQIRDTSIFQCEVESSPVSLITWFDCWCSVVPSSSGRFRVALGLHLVPAGSSQWHRWSFLTKFWSDMQIMCICERSKFTDLNEKWISHFRDMLTLNFGSYRKLTLCTLVPSGMRMRLKAHGKNFENTMNHLTCVR